MHISFSLALFSATAMTGFTAAPAFAQDAAAEEEVGVQDIVVTAQKREENLQDTPISIVALSTEALEDRGIGSLSDMFNGSVPSLRIQPNLGRTSSTSIGMRGLVPADSTQVSRDPAVGIYIDGVLVARSSGLGTELADIERIEVLRGPQGTLFGRNTLGGAVSIVSKRPTGELSFDLKAGISSFRGRSFATHINLPEVQGLSFKIDGVYESRDGLVRNPLAGSHDYGEVEKYGFRISALWEATDRLKFFYAYDNSRDKSTNYYSYMTETGARATAIPTFITTNTTVVGPNSGLLSPAFNSSGQPITTTGLPTLLVESGNRVDVARIGMPVYTSPQLVQGHSLTSEWDVSDNLTIRSITAWRKLDSTQNDSDAGSQSTWGANRRFGRISFARVNQKQFSEELQFVGDVGNIKYVFGGFYFKEKGRDTATVFSAGVLNGTSPPTTFTLFPTPTADAGANVPDRASNAFITSKALFGQVTWSPLGPVGLHVTAGARYTDDKKRGTLLLLAGRVPTDPLDLTKPLSFSFKSSRVDPMVTIAYDFSKDINAYVKWSRAYRAGGANSRSATFRTFDEEVLTAWEAGIKADLLDRRVRVNLAAYSSTLKGQQTDFANPANPSNQETLNAKEERTIKGIETDLTIVPVRGLSLTASYTYTDAPPTPITNPFTNVLGPSYSLYTPTHAATFGLDYAFPRMSIGELRFHLDANTGGGYRDAATPVLVVKKALVFNGRIALGDINLGGGKFELSLWGKNLTNTTYPLVQLNAASTIGRQIVVINNDPRTFGIDARVRF